MSRPLRVSIEVRLLDAELASEAFDTDGLAKPVRRELESRRRLWEEGLGTAYVAVDAEGRPCYVQWAIPGSEADHVDRFFQGAFVHLEPDELLLEAAWALPRARGQRIMSDAMSRITMAGARREHRRAITFVRVDNEPSLRGCYSAGSGLHRAHQQLEVRSPSRDLAAGDDARGLCRSAPRAERRDQLIHWGRASDGASLV